jgi:hypothetical protein
MSVSKIIEGKALTFEEECAAEPHFFAVDHSQNPGELMEQVAEQLAKFGLTVTSYATVSDFYAFTIEKKV